MKKNVINGIVMVVLILSTLTFGGLYVSERIQSEERKEKDAAIIHNQADVIMQTSYIINDLENRNARLENDLMVAQSMIEVQEDIINQQANIVADANIEIEELKDIIRDSQEIATTEGNLEEQYDEFIDWTSDHSIVVDLKLIDEIVEYNKYFINLPTINMINANAIYNHKLNLTTLHLELIDKQDEQIKNYSHSISLFETQVDNYKTSLQITQEINENLTEVVRQERRRTRAFAIIAGVAIGYVVYEAAF